MDYVSLGRTDLSVSRVCLGTMTWGEQNTRDDAFRQLDRALDAGVNFIDTAEMYPIPPRGGSAGETERIIGEWIAARGARDRVVLATKITGPGLGHIRGGNAGHDRNGIRQAVEDSLRRLRTDVIDLYQIHWPERRTNYFGQRGYVHRDDGFWTPLAEVLDALADQVTDGKVRAVGVSNETPWGVMSYLARAGLNGLPRMASIQNPYSLLNRLFEVGLAEVAHREDCGLLAYSALGFGTLSGKYLDGAAPPHGRLTLFPQYGRYTKPNGVRATQEYVALAQRHGLDPAQMALAFVLSRPFVTSVIIGATTMDQLESNLGAVDVRLPDDVLAQIDAIHEANPNPAP